MRPPLSGSRRRGELAGWDELRAFAEARLGNRREASWLVEAVATGRETLRAGGDRRGARSDTAASRGEAPTESQRQTLNALVARRLRGEPLQYVLGSWQFRNLELVVDRRGLIPRPETEQVVEVALREVRRVANLAYSGALQTLRVSPISAKSGEEARKGEEAEPSPPDKVGKADTMDAAGDCRDEALIPRSSPVPAVLSDLNVVDLGTGSGAIAMSIAAEAPRLLVSDTTLWQSGHTQVPLDTTPVTPKSAAEASAPRGRRALQVDVWATDLSAEALELAEDNRRRLAQSVASGIRLRQGDWWQALPSQLRGAVGVAVSNPPYISTTEMATLDAVVAEWEPRGALEAGPTGIEAHHRILSEAAGWLVPGGAIILEIAPHQAKDVVELAEAAGLSEVEVHPDLAGRKRIVVARLKL